MSNELRGLIIVLRRGRLDWSYFDQSRIRAAFLMPYGVGIAPAITDTSEDEVDCSQEDVATPSSHLPSSHRLERQLSSRSSFRTSRSASVGKVIGGLPLIPILDSDDKSAYRVWRSPVSLSPGSQDDSVAASRKRRRSSNVATPRPSRSEREPKRWKLVFEGDGPLSVTQDDLVSLARRTRSTDCRPPSLISLGEEEAYAKVVVASSKVCFASPTLFESI
ncbi:hypothetical protein YC2023_041465 [Brassica napus]